jgi:hypothetical protein
MPDLFNRRTKPKNLKEWLSQLGRETGEENTRSHLKGTNLKDNDKETPSEDTETSISSNLPTERRRFDIFRGFSGWLRASNILPQRRKTIENRIPAMEDEQVIKRLVGDTVQNIPVVKSLFKLKRRRLPLSQPVSQPETESQIDTDLIVTQRKQHEIEEPDFDQMRMMALQGYEPTVRGESEVDRSAFSRLRKWFDRLSILQKISLLLGALFALGLSILLIVLVTSRPSHPVVSTPDVYLYSSGPIPSSVILPDSQAFELGVGTLTNGFWTPQSAEWLAGTEVPRWLALPWNRSLESAFLAFEVNVPIQLQMSNGDILVYRFQSVQELSTEEIGTFHANTADLLIVLSKPNASTRLVIIATP